MTEEVAGISAEEIKRAEEVMTPIQRVMTNARFEVLSHEQDFITAGITKEQIQQASNNAGERAKREFEEKEKQDPLIRIFDVVSQAVISDNERLITSGNRGVSETTRKNWKDLIGKLKMTISARDPSQNLDDLQQVLLQAERFGYGFNQPSHQKYDFNDGVVYTSFPVINNWEIAGKKPDTPSPEFMVRVLRGLGALNEDQDLTYLMSLPNKVEKGKPFRSGGNIYDLHTKIPGVRLFIGIEPNNSFISAELTPDTLKQVVDLPNS